MGVQIRPSREFQAARLEGYTSTFYPCSSTWSTTACTGSSADAAVSAQVIELDERGDTLVYRDSGPGIAADIADRVFDFGFTHQAPAKRPRLAIASQVLDGPGGRSTSATPMTVPRCEFLIRQDRGA